MALPGSLKGQRVYATDNSLPVQLDLTRVTAALTSSGKELTAMRLQESLSSPEFKLEGVCNATVLTWAKHVLRQGTITDPYFSVAPTFDLAAEDRVPKPAPEAQKVKHSGPKRAFRENKIGKLQGFWVEEYLIAWKVGEVDDRDDRRTLAQAAMLKKLKLSESEQLVPGAFGMDLEQRLGAALALLVAAQKGLNQPHRLSLSTTAANTSGYHAMGLIIMGETVYILDPNFGLFRYPALRTAVSDMIVWLDDYGVNKAPRLFRMDSSA